MMDRDESGPKTLVSWARYVVWTVSCSVQERGVGLEGEAFGSKE